MLTNCLIFLLTSFITCRPTTPSPPLKELNEEIQDLLEEMTKQLPVAQKLPMAQKLPVANKTTFRIADLTKTEQCAMLRLEKFITLLNPLKTENAKVSNINELYKKLQEFNNSWPLQEEKSDQECKTEEYVDHGLSNILDDLSRLMKKFYCIRMKC